MEGRRKEKNEERKGGEREEKEKERKGKEDTGKETEVEKEEEKYEDHGDRKGRRGKMMEGRKGKVNVKIKPKRGPYKMGYIRLGKFVRLSDLWKTDRSNERERNEKENQDSGEINVIRD